MLVTPKSATLGGTFEIPAPKLKAFEGVSIVAPLSVDAKVKAVLALLLTRVWC